MSALRRRFKNEYGRDIEISIDSTKVGGQRAGQRFQIEISGPDSVATNEVTPREAIVLANSILTFAKGRA